VTLADESVRRGKPVQYRLETSSDGLVTAHLEGDLRFMQHALEDSLGSRPPRGARQDGPSTYWLDRAITQLVERLKDGGSEPFASGNVTYLQVRDQQVEARYDFDPEDSDSVDAVPADDFLTLLRAWRKRVLDESPEADQRVPPPPAARPMPPA
jgi:hypothetical protein